MANPTTNYGFVLPTSSDLVTDLPADFDVALQGVDTRLKALQPGTTLGDLAYSSATANTNTRLGIGTSGQVLAVSGGGVPAWTTTADVTPLTTKGDVFTFTTVDARLGVGANGTVLTADSAEATGLKWATAGAASPDWALVSTTATTSGASITISGLGSYKSLLVLCTTVGFAGNDQLIVQVNGSSTGNYFSFGLRADGTGLFNGESGSNQTLWSMGGAASARRINSSLFLRDCQTTGFKTGQIIGGDETAATSAVQQIRQVMWANSATISSLVFSSFSNNFDEGSIAIYGSTV